MIEQKNAYEVAVRAAADKKGAAIEILDMSQILFYIVGYSLCLFYIISRNNVEENLKKEGFTVYHREGYTTGRWILLDAGETIVHIFVSDDREYYGLEQVWADVPRLKVAGE